MNSLDYVVQKVLSVIRRDITKKTTGYDAIGIVRRIDGNTAWVHFDNGVDETPVNKSINCTKGDKVRVRISNGSAFLVGNDSAPPTDDTKAEHAQVTAEISGRTAEEAQTTASEAEQEAAIASQTAEAADTKADTALEQVGTSITTDTLHYLATDQSSGVTTSTPGWTTTVQAITSALPYLWTYHTYHKASGQSVNTQPVITGVYGDTGATGPQGPAGQQGEQGPAGSDGDDGISVTAVQPQYYLSTSSSSATGGSWGNSLSYETGKYIWTRDKVSYSNNTTGYSTAIYNQALTEACSTSEQALNVAEGIDEHFWYDNTGAHVTEDTQEDYQQDPSSAGGNTLITSQGVAIRKGTKELASFDAINGVQIGLTDKAHLIEDAQSLSFIDKDRITFFKIEDIRDATGYAEIQEVVLGDGNTSVFQTEYWISTLESVTLDGTVLVEGTDYTFTDYSSYQEIRFTTAPSDGARIVFNYISDDSSLCYFTFGTRNEFQVKGGYSFASGQDCIASGFLSTAFGNGGEAGGAASFAVNGTADGYGAISFGGTAEGNYTFSCSDGGKAIGDESVVFGRRTTANYQRQFIIGKYNDNKSDDVFEIGNGSNGAPSNAFEVTQTGDITASGKATLGAINGTGLFGYTTVSMTSSSIAANASGEVTSSASTNSKYYPIAITNVNISTGQASLRRFYFSTQEGGRAVVKIGLQNDGTSAKTISVSADILWVKIAV